jgi:hypothetical protein
MAEIYINTENRGGPKAMNINTLTVRQSMLVLCSVLFLIVQQGTTIAAIING